MHSQPGVRMQADTYQAILHSITAFTLIVQFYVVFLVQKKSPHSMREYRFFLNMFTFYDMFFTIALGVGLQPDTFPDKLASWCRGVAYYFGPDMELFVLGLTIFFGSNMIIAQDYCLMYRFTVIHNNKKIHSWFMSIPFKIGWFIFAQMVSVFLGYFISKVCYQPEEFQQFILTEPPEVRQLVKPGQFVMWVNIEKPLTSIYMGAMLILFTISETLCITLIHLILSTLRKNVEVFSRTTYRLHIQLTILLAFQLATPFILVLLPLSAVLILAFIGKFSAQLTGQIGFIVIEMYGVTNALFTVSFVGPYRIYTYNKLIRPWYQHLVKINPLLMRQMTTSVATASTNEQSSAIRGLSIRKSTHRLPNQQRIEHARQHQIDSVESANQMSGVGVEQSSPMDSTSIEPYNPVNSASIGQHHPGNVGHHHSGNARQQALNEARRHHQLNNVRRPHTSSMPRQSQGRRASAW